MPLEDEAILTAYRRAAVRAFMLRRYDPSDVIDLLSIFSDETCVALQHARSVIEHEAIAHVKIGPGEHGQQSNTSEGADGRAPSVPLP